MALTRKAILATVVVASVTTSPVALAETDGGAEALVRQGIEFRKEFKDQEALDCFLRAYRIRETPRTLVQIGTAEQALGRWVEAERHISAGLAASGDPWISRNRSALEEALSTVRGHVGDLDLISIPVGASIVIDGQEVGTTPLVHPLRLPIGSTVVQVRAPGYFPATRTVSVTAGQLTRETVTLSPTDALGGNTGPGTFIGTGNALGGGPGAPADSTAAEGRSSRRTLAMVFAGAAVGFTAAGTTALVLRNGKAHDYNSLVDSSGCTGTAASTCADLRNSGNRYRNWAIVGFSVAGVMAAAGTYLFLTEGSRSDEGHRTAALSGCSIAYDLSALACRFVF